MADFANPSFEVAGTQPGAADAWAWEDFSADADVWASFNDSTAVERAWRAAIELFEARHAIAPTLFYADEAERLAAGGFVAADIKRVARQASDNTLWILTGNAPVAWAALLAYVEDAVSSFATGFVLAQFNGAASAFTNTIELFELWNGLPCVSPIAWQRQDELGVGFRNWYEGPLTDGLSTYVLETPLAQEGFIDGWVMPGFLCGSAAPSGELRGAPLSFPLSVPHNQNRLMVWRVLTNTVHEIVITPGVYADAETLAADIEASWSAMIGGGPIATEWSTWSANGETGLAFRATGTSGIEQCYLCTLARTADNDARPLLGLRGWGPGGASSAIAIAPSLITNIAITQPLEGGDTFVVDFWARLSFHWEFDPAPDILAPWLVEDDFMPALFGLYNPGGETSYRERWNLRGWFGPSATYHNDIGTMTATAASFVGGVGPGAIIESFEHPSLNWPDYI